MVPEPDYQIATYLASSYLNLVELIYQQNSLYVHQLCLKFVKVGELNGIHDQFEQTAK